MPNDKWIIMAYFAGNNNLEEEMVFAIKELCRVGSPKDLDIYVQFDCGGPPIRFPAKTFDESELTPDEREDADLEMIGRILSASEGYSSDIPTAEILEEFMCYCINESKEAERYMLILSGHGSGAVGDFLSGDHPGSGLTINGLERTLKNVANRMKPDRSGPNAKKKLLDILGMDSCLMGMVETAYAVRESVDCMIAAEGFETNTGWPYARFLNRIKETEGTPDYALNLDPAPLAERIAGQYCEYYKNYTLADVSTDMAALKLSEIGELVNSVNTLTRDMEEKLDNQGIRDSILLAHWEAQAYKDEQYVDLWDFCSRLEARSDDLSQQCQAVKTAIGKVVLLSCFTGAAFQHSHGISVFFPWAEIEDVTGTSEFEFYRNLSWAQHSHWDNFLAEYVKKTQLLPRSCGSFEELENDQAIEDPANRKFRKSRANRRFGAFREADQSIRWAPPRSRWAPPRSRGGGGDIGKMGTMQNPPVYYPVRREE